MGFELRGVGGESERFLRLANTGVRLWRIKGDEAGSVEGDIPGTVSLCNTSSARG